MNSIPRYNWPKIRGAEPRQTPEGVLGYPPTVIGPNSKGKKAKFWDFSGWPHPLQGHPQTPSVGQPSVLGFLGRSETMAGAWAWP